MIDVLLFGAAVGVGIVLGLALLAFGRGFIIAVVVAYRASQTPAQAPGETEPASPPMPDAAARVDRAQVGCYKVH